MQRYFIKKFNHENKSALLEGNDFHHIKNVMRHKVNDYIIVCNEEGICLISEIVAYGNKIVKVNLKQEVESKDLLVQVDIAQSLIRRDKFEYMIQKSTELGVNNIIPILTKNVIVKIDANKQSRKIDRWNLLAKEASEQSHRNKRSNVLSIHKLKELDFLNYDVVLIAYEKENQSNNLRTILQKKYNKILVIIGPEGGFTENEIAELESFNNTYTVGLGKRILRSETASSYILSVLSYVYEMSE